MEKKPKAQILYLRPRQASAGRTTCLACTCIFIAYTEEVNALVLCPECGGSCRVGQK
jgi:PHP family Zn ribbon phosphoesterase